MSFSRICHVTDSAVIKEIAYDHTSRKLRITFKSTDSIWEYENVWPSDFARLVCAHSPGQVFNESIRNRYTAVRLVPAPTRTVERTVST